MSLGALPSCQPTIFGWAARTARPHNQSQCLLILAKLSRRSPSTVTLRHSTLLTILPTAVPCSAKKALGFEWSPFIVSGGANGIGQAFAQRLAQDGAHIVIADIASGSDTVKMVEQAGRQALARICDVSSVDSVKALASDVTKHLGRCDILINCAGIFPNTDGRDEQHAKYQRCKGGRP